MVQTWDIFICMFYTATLIKRGWTLAYEKALNSIRSCFWHTVYFFYFKYIGELSFKGINHGLAFALHTARQTSLISMLALLFFLQDTILSPLSFNLVSNPTYSIFSPKLSIFLFITVYKNVSMVTNTIFWQRPVLFLHKTYKPRHEVIATMWTC